MINVIEEPARKAKSTEARPCANSMKNPVAPPSEGAGPTWAANIP